MTEEDIVDPRVVPRWVEAGVSGVPRGREWDWVTVVEAPELEGLALAEIAFRALEDGTLVPAPGDALPRGALERLAARAEEAVRPPYEAFAARRGRRDWSLAARELRLERVDLPSGLEAGELAVAVDPTGLRTLLVDGEEPAALTPALEEALSRLERLGRERFPSFVARAERVAPGRWELTVDPL